ncbi:MAG: hypothetical protein AVDCRST_MAG58-3602 [uncultured Rubrobacteraceae bacterium]|uniref:SnoaL-like domain-containing protein n=1 Tax=uncultured Rubrobacteraceae bacterium TaxID=349277 RepID=A0A6J4RBU9_9ACTN|nr:MAG: hypothetical protein AVDCRST_MAG58-3602 [uncultured Rubrobacteraceae bacterium]
MTAEENKALARMEIEEIWTKGNLAAADEIYAPNYTSHQPAGAEDIRGLGAIKLFRSLPGDTERKGLKCATFTLPSSLTFCW